MEARILNKTDLDWLFVLEAECFGSGAWTTEMLYSHLDEASAIGATDLCYILYKLSGEEIEIYRVAVHPRHRKKGIAKKLLDYLLNSEREKSFFLEVSSLNLPAIGLYEACGFQRIHVRKRYYEDGSDALIYKKASPDVSEIFNFEVPD
ncbi:GNAT family N-acetyltransferase [Leptospira yasudae]|uniref:GNAT family N-acetyltransferase n=1 Tax=Leptospira yasudae TaxID=2202201 RepID=A0ABX9M6N6_9LEPT|nr:N-acetyltransferase [Leptospira yasudae]MBW0432611.1 GNAT family N-acetyltransferase [Leptospira yasudae]RHX81522.1 GNAT family N-acetyltransferase [Leptospira yasudae]TGK29752.1 N-acetyltransferase [Leptospira yasudae]TGM07623.1 N-acetyltransferase [Leptospira yasudae]TGN01395.1 N-acetyltransferase [Leptospira yasudae]